MQDATKLSKRIVAMGTCGGVGVVLLIFTYVYKDYIIINHHYKTWVICTRVAWSLLLLKSWSENAEKKNSYVCKRSGRVCALMCENSATRVTS